MKRCDCCNRHSSSCVRRFDVVPEELGVHAAVFCPKCNRLWETSRNPTRDEMREAVVDRLHLSQPR